LKIIEKKQTYVDVSLGTFSKIWRGTRGMRGKCDKIKENI